MSTLTLRLETLVAGVTEKGRLNKTLPKNAGGLATTVTQVTFSN